ncbi:MAG: hypothetical protein FD183_1216 [Chitinophagaceae bacterium]|nr:MAG: hypothetical protein FD183_1216 [Chitinophagaceae bacterium]
MPPILVSRNDKYHGYGNGQSSKFVQNDAMLVIGLIREGKIPSDNRVALTPAQCKFLSKHYTDIQIKVQTATNRCYTDHEYEQAGIEITDDLSDCSLILGIKEIPVNQLIPNKRYMFFSHTKKMQPYNQLLMQAMVEKQITLIDYECLEHRDGQRIIGFGFFAGIVGAHNGIMAYGNRTGAYQLERVHHVKDYRHLIHTYFGLKLPPIKIAVIGSGRVAHGIVEVMNLMDAQEVEPEDYLTKKYEYPVYVQLKGNDLYRHKSTGKYSRDHFHANPDQYDCLFNQYIAHTTILMNGIYWSTEMPRLFTMNELASNRFGIQVARMAGMPISLINRANTILAQLEQQHVKEDGKERTGEILKQISTPQVQLSIFDAHSATFDSIRKMLTDIDINQLTPVEALMKLNEVKNLLK